MEDVLVLYEEPYDPQRPVVCMDETSKQLVGETRRSIPARPGQPRRLDYEYERRGTADVFMFTEPLRNWRSVEVTALERGLTGQSRSRTWSMSTTRVRPQSAW